MKAHSNQRVGKSPSKIFDANCCNFCRLMVIYRDHHAHCQQKRYNSSFSGTADSDVRAGQQFPEHHCSTRASADPYCHHAGGDNRCLRAEAEATPPSTLEPAPPAIRSFARDSQGRHNDAHPQASGGGDAAGAALPWPLFPGSCGVGGGGAAAASWPLYTGAHGGAAAGQGGSVRARMSAERPELTSDIRGGPAAPDSAPRREPYSPVPPPPSGLAAPRPWSAPREGFPPWSPRRA